MKTHPGHFHAGSALEALVHLLRGRSVVVLSGAGCSTESGIPDYGGLGARRRRSLVQYRAFVSDATIRARYWARSAVGWRRVAHAQPNGAHLALAHLEQAGTVVGVITQNVDGLHHRAGSEAVVELHGSLARVRCLACRSLESRAGLQERLLALNPLLADPAAPSAPDGDAEVPARRYDTFRVPNCVRCGGVLKPDVVFFGEPVPRELSARAWALYDRASVVLVVGSSLAVFSGFRFVLRAAKDGRPVAIVNLGPTRGDRHAAAKIEETVGTFLPALARRLCDVHAALPLLASER